MRLAIFGATGRSGRVIVEQSLQLGHQVTALARKPENVPHHEHLRAVAGDVCDPAPVARTVADADVVISALGRRRRGPSICTEGMRVILAAMASDGPRRLIALSNYGVAETRHRSLFVAVSWLLERSVLRDKEDMEAAIRAGDTEWTLIRPPVLTDGPRTKRYHTGVELRLTVGSRVSRADLAAFTLSAAEDNTYVRQGVAIAY